MKELKIDRLILAYVEEHPGTNVEQLSRGILEFYSQSYTRDRVLRLSACGILRSEREDGRYRLFVGIPPMEAGGA